MYKKGVIPAAGSPTATLLRLHISHNTYSKIQCINAPIPISFIPCVLHNVSIRQHTENVFMFFQHIPNNEGICLIAYRTHPTLCASPAPIM